MKKNNLLLVVTIVIALLFSACGGSTSIKNNKFLGEFPSLHKKYTQKVSEKEKSAKECTDLEKALKMGVEVKNIKTEMSTEVEKYVKEYSMCKDLPFKALEGRPYVIEKVCVNKASSGNLSVKFDITINQDINGKYGLEKTLFVYYKAIDEEGNGIPGTETVATNFKRQDLKAGLKYEAYGSWGTSDIAKLENFAEIVEMTEEEYKKKQ